MITKTRLNGLQNGPITQIGTGSFIKTGSVWYVSSVTGNLGNRGNDPAFPLATINQAQLSATASNGDIVILMPGHAETITAAAGIALSKAGVTYVGIGEGSLRPTITFTTATTATMTVTGANITVQNVKFVNAIDAQVSMIPVSSADVSFIACEFATNSGTTGAVLGILTAATADRLVVDSCRFVGPATNTGTTTTAQIKHEVGVDYQISNNYFAGKMTQAILNATTNLRGLISNNYIVVGTGTSAITMAAASTPFITNNRINVASGSTPITAAAGFVAGNVYSAAVGVTAGTASTI